MLGIINIQNGLTPRANSGWPVAKGAAHGKRRGPSPFSATSRGVCSHQGAGQLRSALSSGCVGGERLDSAYKRRHQAQRRFVPNEGSGPTLNQPTMGGYIKSKENHFRQETMRPPTPSDSCNRSYSPAVVLTLQPARFELPNQHAADHTDLKGPEFPVSPSPMIAAVLK
jgi:hypothetical protein